MSDLEPSGFQLFIGRKKMTKEKAAVEANLIGGKNEKRSIEML